MIARFKNHADIASDISISSSPATATPCPATMLERTSARSGLLDGKSTGVEPNPAGSFKGSALATERSRKWKRHVSPTAIAAHLQPPFTWLSFNPANAAKEPTSAFSSANHESLRPCHVALRAAPSPAAQPRKESASRQSSSRATQAAANRFDHEAESNASVAPSATANLKACLLTEIESSHSASE